jgi:hypothetical protein
MFEKGIEEQEKKENPPESEKKCLKKIDIFRKNKDKVEEIPMVIEIKDKIEDPIQKGGEKPDRYTIHNVDGIYKMHINDEYTTLTEQGIDPNDKTLSKKIYNRKNVRRHRNKDK